MNLDLSSEAVLRNRQSFESGPLGQKGRKTLHNSRRSRKERRHFCCEVLIISPHPDSARERSGELAVINPSVACCGDVKQRPCRSKQPAIQYDEAEAAVEGKALTLHRMRNHQNPAEGLMRKASLTIQRGGSWIDCAQCLALWRSQAGYPTAKLSERAVVLERGLLSVSLCQAEPCSSVVAPA